MKLRLAVAAACLLTALVAGCTYVLEGAGRATPPASSGLAITRPDRPTTALAEPTMCSLTPSDEAPCATVDEGETVGYPSPSSTPQMAAVSGYPGPGDLPPATVVLPSATPPAGDTPSEPTDPAPVTPSVIPAQPTATPAETATPRAPAPTPSDPLDRAMLSAVRVESPAHDGSGVGAWRFEGLGVVLSSGQIVAPLHVLYDGTSGQLYDADGEVDVQAFDAAGYPIARARAALRAWNAGLDLAVLATTSEVWAPPADAAPGAADEASLPTGVPLRVVLLSPERESATRVMQTEVSGRYEDDGGPWIVAAANISAGAIGGGVAFNAAGQVVGLLQPEGGLAPGQLVRIRPLDAAEGLLSAEAAPRPLPTTLPVAGEERALRILYRGAEGVNLRSSPSTGATSLGMLYRDEVYPIVAPGEADGWYAIYAGGGRAGWVALRHPTGTRLAEVETTTFESALTEGEGAEVACLSAVPGRGCANLRATPGWRNKAQDDVLAELPPGRPVQLLDGPRQADGLTWWQVRDAQDDIEGWIAEVTAGGYRALVAE